MVMSDTGNTIFTSGSIHNTTTLNASDHKNFFYCRYNTSTPTLECAYRPNVGTPDVYSKVANVYTNQDTWLYMIAYDSTIGHYAIKVHSNLTYIWTTGIDCTAPSSDK